jgi:hypothetical protein
MQSHWPWLTAVLLAIPLLGAPAARAADICSALTEAEVSAAVGTPLQRSPSDPCRFGHAFQSVHITMHAGGASGFDGYATEARREFKDVQTVPGVGAKAIFFGFDLAVQYKNDLFVVAMFMGKSSPEKIALAKAVAVRVMSHM